MPSRQHLSVSAEPGAYDPFGWMRPEVTRERDWSARGLDVLPDPIAVGAVALRVADLGTMAGFYEKVLGLTVLDRGERHAALGHRGKTLITLRAETGLRRAEPGTAGLHYVAFLMPSRRDLACWFNHAVRIRVPFVAAFEHSASEGVYITDPEGNGVEITASLTGTDGRAAPETGPHFRVEPLDIHALMERASIDEFKGFPDGGRVGHVDLRVGDLDMADAFYRGVLGFEVVNRMQGISTFASGRNGHQISVNVFASFGAGRRQDRSTGLDAIELVVRDPADREDILARARSEGRCDGDSIVDPWGTRITLRG